MGESNMVVSAYRWYRHLQQYYSHPSILALRIVLHSPTDSVLKKNNQTAKATIFFLIKAHRAMQNMDSEFLFCSQFAKQKLCPVLCFFVFYRL